MSLLDVTDASARTDRAATTALLESLHAALHGLPPGGGWTIPAEAGSAFAPAAEVTPLPAPDGVWAVLREADDAQVLCLHNPAPHPATVPLSHLIPGASDRAAYFLKGEMSTSDGADGTNVGLVPHGYVWLAFPRPPHQ